MRRAWLPMLLVLLPALAAGRPGWAQEQPAGEPLGQVWRRPVASVIALAVSPEGERTLALDLEGVLHCYDQAGAVRWEQQLPDADHVVTSRRAALTLAYAEGQPLAREVTFIDRDGRRFYILKPSAPVAFAEVSPSGRYAAVASGRSVIFCSVEPTGVRHRVIRLPGDPRQVQFGPADSLYVVCRNPDLVLRVKSTGTVIWKYSDRRARNYAISASEDGRLVGIGSEREDDTVVAALLDASRRQLWRINAPGRAPRVRLAASGAAMIIAYEHKVVYQDQSRFQRLLLYLPRDLARARNSRWPKGGAFNTPYFVSVDRDGGWVVTLDAQSGVPRLRLYGSDGERRYHYTSPARVLIATSSLDGRHIALYGADGALATLQVGGERE